MTNDNPTGDDKLSGSSRPRTDRLSRLFDDSGLGKDSANRKQPVTDGQTATDGESEGEYLPSAKLLMEDCEREIVTWLEKNGNQGRLDEIVPAIQNCDVNTILAELETKRYVRRQDIDGRTVYTLWFRKGRPTRDRPNSIWDNLDLGSASGPRPGKTGSLFGDDP